MGCRVLCLTLFTLLSGCLGQQCILITPNVLRLESEETIVVDGRDKAFEAEVEIHDFPKRSWFLAKQKISINNGNQFLGTATVRIPPYELTKDPKETKYVYVLVKSPVCNLEKIVLLSNQNKYAFIQTDKTIYTPGSNVLYRIFSMNYKMSPPVNTSLIIEFLTPEKVFVKREEAIIDESGIVSSSHRLSEVASLGVWTISAKFKDFSGQIYTTNFGVKEFVPPTYEITLIPEKKYFYVDDTEFSVKIEAKFIHGDPVNGKALVIFGINRDSAKTSLPNTMKWIMINEGEGMAQLLRKDLVSNFRNDEDMLECTLYMSITLITGSGSYIVESELKDIHIVKSPYKVLFTRTSKYFKPTMPFDLMVFVTNPDGSPATKVPVVAEPGMVLGRTGEEGTARMTLNTNNKNSLQITVRTADPALPAERQTTASMEANAYWSLGNYLYIGISPPEVTHGDIVTVKFFVQNSNPASQNQIQHLTYLIMSKGSILKVGRQPKLQGQDLVTISLPITEEFIPSFRIVAYYMVGNEIVSDSLHVDVTDSEQCIGTVLVTGDSNSDNGVQVPGARMRLKLQADHKAYVGLVAIDKGLNVLNRKFKMSQKKVWDTIGKSDLGCTPGSGTNSMGVFYDAGLALQSSFQTTTPERSEPQCAVHGFRKRRSFNDGEDFIPDNEIISRANFPESWLWKIVQMTEKPDKNGLSTTMLNVFLKDSITTWEVLAVSLSPNKGICIAKPHEIQVKTQLFTDLKVPYSVVIKEQVEIQAIIYNYGHQNIKARVTLTHNPAFCSLSTAKKNYRQSVDIKAQSSVSVPFTLIPLSLGSHDIEVKASGNFVSDGVKKKLKVVPEGHRMKTIRLVTLDPQVKGTDGVQVETVPALDEKNIVPGTEIETIVTVQGNPINQIEANIIDGAHLRPLIVAPSGQSVASTVIATIYLDAINQWDRIGVNQRDEAIKYIRQGYSQQVSYGKVDGSVAVIISLPDSTWLTAFAIRVFAMAHPLLNIDSTVLCNSIKWLILEKQKPEGLFKDDIPVLVGDIKGSSEDVSLTVFALIAMLESEKSCTPHVNILKGSIERAANYLLGQLPGLTKPYTIAITSYALAMAGSIDQPVKLLSATTDNVYWESGSRYLTIEATSYALLTLLRLKQYDQTGPIVRWIIEQKYYGDVYSNTQATYVMYQALAQYQIDSTTRNDMDLQVTLNLPNIIFPLKYHISSKTAMLAQSASTSLNKEFTVTAEGKGQGIMTIMSLYHTIQTEKQECKNFDLTATVEEELSVRGPEGALSTLSVEICVRHLKGNDASMSILDVSMMTGFVPDIESLNKLKKGVDKYISHFEIKESISKGSLIIYVEKISHTQQECIKFNVHQMFKVGLIQPASVTVYDYYSPESRCTKLYDVNKNSKLFGTICQNDICRCAEGDN